MQIITIPAAITVYGCRAESFPKGIMDAHKQLHQKTDSSNIKAVYGVSWMQENGEMIYVAAAELSNTELPHIATYEAIVLKAGDYITEEIPQVMQHIQEIPQVFERLLQTDNIDKKGIAVEWYREDGSCLCMVRLEE